MYTDRYNITNIFKSEATSYVPDVFGNDKSTRAWYIDEGCANCDPAAGKIRRNPITEFTGMIRRLAKRI